MNNFKKYIAITLATVLTLSTSVMALAGITGEGELEGTVDTDVYSVILPTEAAQVANLDFILDPEELIANTDAAKYNGADFEDGATLFFANGVSENATYSSKSDDLTVVNKSTFDVDVAVSATITGADGITLTDDKTFADDKNASVYLALVDGDNEVAITADGASLKSKIAKAPEGAYEYSWSEQDGYKYELSVSANDMDFEDYSFNLTGACNSAGDWSELESIAPSVEVTWEIKEHKDNAAPSLGTTAVTFSKASGATIPVDLGGGDLGATGIKSIATIVNGKAYAWATSDYTLSGSSVKIPTTASVKDLAVGQTRTVKVTFADKAATTATFTLTIAN